MRGIATGTGLLLSLCVGLADRARADVNPYADVEAARLSVRPLTAFTAGDEQRFNELIDEVVDHFRATVAAYGGTLIKAADWESATVNATANIFGNEWRIIAFGGLFRVSGMTDDAFQLAICHEAGHLLGGFPYYEGGINATSEGQADYFAAQVCAPKIWRGQVEANLAAAASAPAAVNAACATAWTDVEDAQVCARVALAGESVIRTLTPGNLSLATPDTSVASATLFSTYPRPQCRVDTFFRGALCSAAWDFELIPGRTVSPRNGPLAEVEAHRYSCHRNQIAAGARPACWYRQRVD